VSDVARWYVERIKELEQVQGVDRVAFVEGDRGPIGAIALKSYVVAETRIASVDVRLRRRLASTAVKDLGNPLRAGDRVVLVGDVATTGRQLVHAASRLKKRADDLQITALVYYDRCRGAEGSLLDHGVGLVKYMTEPAHNVVVQAGQVGKSPA